jgi:hypothetical protein
MFKPGGTVNWQGAELQAFTTLPANSAFSAPVFTCERWRVSVFSEARFTWQRIRNGRPLPGGLFGTTGLALLERPWPGARTRDLLAICELDVAIYGNSYWVVENDWLVRLDPTSVKVLTSAVFNPISGNRVAEQLEGYAVMSGKKELAIYTPDEMAHYKPMPDARNRWVGQSWIAACGEDSAADMDMQSYLRSVIVNGAQLTHVVSVDPELSPEQFDNFVYKFNEAHKGPSKAGKTLFIQGGTDIRTVGQTLEQMAFRSTQGAGEVRIAAVAGVPTAIAGFSEGLKGSALNSGVYNSAKESFIDGTICPLWGAFVEAFASLIVAPGPDVRLWYDRRDIPFLAKDVQTEAEVLAQQATALNVLVMAGYDPDAAVYAITTNDLSGLTGTHSGLFSVQMQSANSTSDTKPADTKPTTDAMPMKKIEKKPAMMNGKG